MLFFLFYILFCVLFCVLFYFSVYDANKDVISIQSPEWTIKDPLKYIEQMH